MEDEYHREQLRMERAKEEKLCELLGNGDPKALLLMKHMSAAVSQNTFDEVVKENMEEFEMSREEAIEDAIEQLKKQGANLQKVNTE